MDLKGKQNSFKEDFVPLETLQPHEMKTIGRRSVIKKITVGGAALAGLSALPDRWTAPLVEFGSLPAHATTSGSIESVIEELKQELEKTDQAEAAAANQTDEPAAGQASAAEEQAGESEPAPEEDLRGFSNKVTINNTGAKVSIDSIWQDKFVFPKLGPEYGPRLLVVWSDGRELSVADSSKMAMLAAPDGRKYQPGGPYSHNNPDIPTMEVYAAIATHPDSVTVYY
jgi:hypothetical protein